MIGAEPRVHACAFSAHISVRSSSYGARQSLKTAPVLADVTNLA
jgi:hypothetical protein